MTPSEHLRRDHDRFTDSSGFEPVPSQLDKALTLLRDATAPSLDTKSCPHCKRALPIKEFAPRRKGATVRQSWCRSCVNETRREAYANRKENAHG